MTENSFPWSARVVGDGGAASYTMSVVEDTNKFLSNIDPTISGVVWWQESPNANLLEPTNPAGSTVRIASGVGIVEGWIYTNDANVDFDINASPGNANATDIIVLRRVLASQTVRLARINGAASSTAVLTQTAATWEIPIAEVLLDGSGNFSALTDVRRLALPPASKILIERVTPTTSDVLFGSISPLFSSLRIEGRARAGFPGLSIFPHSLGFNFDSAFSYTYIEYGRNSTPANRFLTGSGATSIQFATVTCTTGTANYFDGFDILIPGYAKTTGYKVALAESSAYAVATPEIFMGAGWWLKENAINSIELQLLTTYISGSQVSLYGEV